MRLGNVYIWVVPPCYVVDLMVLRNRVFRLRNVQIYVVLSWKVVVVLIFTNSVSSCKTFNMICVELQMCLFADCQVCHFRSRKFQVIAVPSFKRVDLLMFTNISFMVRNVEICAVLSSNEFDLLILKNRVLRQRNNQKCAVQS